VLVMVVLGMAEIAHCMASFCSSCWRYDYLSLISLSGLAEEIPLFSVCGSKVIELLQYCRSACSVDPTLRHIKTSVFTNCH
jgi:hypothetical protein